jgi:hypothetical protein
MTEALIFDAIRTPRGKGKADGRLHEVKPVDLLAGVLTELQRRNRFDTAAVDDVVMALTAFQTSCNSRSAAAPSDICVLIDWALTGLPFWFLLYLIVNWRSLPNSVHLTHPSTS